MKKLAFIALLVLAGCTSQAPKPENLSEVLGTVDTEILTLSHDIRDAQVSGLITADQAQKMKISLRTAQSQVDLATEAYIQGHSPEALDRVQSVHLVLQVLIKELEDQGVK